MITSHHSDQGGVLPQTPFPFTQHSHDLGTSNKPSSPKTKRSNHHHTDIPSELFITSTSRNEVQPSISIPTTSKNTNKRQSISFFSAPSPPKSPTIKQSALPSSSPSSSMTSAKTSSSSGSSQSLASLAPSMSPSSIISLQRSARQEKRHFGVSSTNNSNRDEPKAKTTAGVNRSSTLSTTIQIADPEQQRYIDEKEELTASIKPSRNRNSSESSSKNRLSKWASSFRHSLSPASKKSTAQSPPPSIPTSQVLRSTKPEHSSAITPPRQDPIPRPYPISQTNTHVHTHTQNTTAYQQPVDTTAEPKTSKVSRWKTTGATSTSSSSSSEQPRIRLLKQSRKRKIGSGLISIFCIIAIVILIVLC